MQPDQKLLHYQLIEKLGEGGMGVVWKATDTSGDLLSISMGHDGFVYSLAYSPDGTRIASGSSDKTVGLWDTASGDLVVTLTGHGSPVYSVAFGPDGSRIVSGSGDGCLRLWDSVPERSRRSGSR